MSFFTLLDYAAVLVFALTGALVASREQLDLVGFAFLAGLTGMGGGTLRDVLLDRPVFWIDDPAYIGVSSAAAVLVYFTSHLLDSRWVALRWVDAAALSVAVAVGSGITVSLSHSAAVVVVMGMVTGCMGGIARDVVTNELPLVLRPGELYVTCAFAGSVATALAAELGVDGAPVAIAAFVITFVLRAGSIHYGWSLPVYKSRPKGGP